MLNQNISIFLNSFLFKIPFLDSFVYFLAQILPFVLFALVVWYFVFHKKEPIKFLLICFVIIASLAFSEILKYIFGAPRPFIAIADFSPLFIFGENDSFPSGHALVSGALAMAVYYENRKLGALFVVCAVLISVARVVSGVHYLADVLAGLLIGFLIVHFSYKYIGKLRNKS